ncbi:MAG: methyltransferase domain-containing protein [Nitrospirae bacterium]|nr:methyltransferase domain-containing protein [Nitrospirota bacterium]
MINRTQQDTKHPCYQDYVIKDGKLVGEFEQMYRDFDDPWEQTIREQWASEKAVVLNLIQKLKARKVIELGCGLGHFTKKISDLGIETIGIDISKTAIEKAKSNYPDCNFVVGDILNLSIYREMKPDLIVMAEITWYVLDKLDNFIEFLKTEMPNTYLIHLLTTYPEGVQKYGKEKFTNLQQIMSYFGAQYLEYGEICYPEMESCKRTFFLGHYKTQFV